MDELIIKLNNLYDEFISSLEINKLSGELGKISNNRYKDHILRFSGYPYVGINYENAKKKILFIGLDIGIDENREDNNYHSFDSRRSVVAGDEKGCASLGYNHHISGTYGMALYILRNTYNWQHHWELFNEDSNSIFQSRINLLKSSLPVDVLDYVALTNIHKFVTKCRGCDFSKTLPKCYSENCKLNDINRSGNSNRKWYNKNIELEMIVEEIDKFNPDIIYFQGSISPIRNYFKSLNSKYEIWIADHPSAWNVGANKLSYIKSDRLRYFEKSI